MAHVVAWVDERNASVTFSGPYRDGPAARTAAAREWAVIAAADHDCGLTLRVHALRRPGLG